MLNIWKTGFFTIFRTIISLMSFLRIHSRYIVDVSRENNNSHLLLK